MLTDLSAMRHINCLLDAVSLVFQVLERTWHQIGQFRQGLEETGLWPLLICRKDVIPILFPRDSEATITPQVQQ